MEGKVYYRNFLYYPSEKTRKKIVFWDIYKDSISYGALMDEIILSPNIVKDCEDEFIHHDLFAFELALKAPQLRPDIPPYADCEGFRNLIEDSDEALYGMLRTTLQMYGAVIKHQGSENISEMREAYFYEDVYKQYKKGFDKMLEDFEKTFRDQHKLKVKFPKSKKDENSMFKDYYYIDSDFKKVVMQEVMKFYSKSLLTPIIERNSKKYLQDKGFMNNVYLNKTLLDRCVNRVAQIDSSRIL